MGGEKISKRVVDTWGASPNVALVNAYGPTEVTIGCSSKLVTPGTNFRSIGRPLGDSMAHILVPGTNQYALRGLPGELCFSGSLVANGYHNRPDAKGFIEDFDGMRLYRTGDIVRMMADDTLEFLGRGDDQTKIRGQRLELGEVSEVIRGASTEEIDVVCTLAQHPGLRKVQLAAFVARTARRTRQRKTDAPKFLEEEYRSWATRLQEACRRQLPSYMVPEFIIPLTFLPLAPMSGKTDLKQLHAILGDISLEALLQNNFSDLSFTSQGKQRECTSEEEEIIKIISRVTSADPLLLHHNSSIFEIGIDSLNAISLTVMLRDLGYSATVAQVMSHPLIEQLARLPIGENGVLEDQDTLRKQALETFDQLQNAFIDKLPSNIDKSAVSKVRPCIPLQEGLVAVSINGTPNQAYVNHITLRLSPRLDLVELKRSWSEAIAANPILRTCFSQFNDKFVQVIYKSTHHIPVWEEHVVEIIEWSISGFRSRREEMNVEMIGKISSIPPVRFCILKSDNSSEPPAMLVSIHHALYDGQSFAMLLDEVAQLYRKQTLPSRGSPDDFLAFLQSQDEAKAHIFWSDLLKDLSPTLLKSNTDMDQEVPILSSRRLHCKLSDLTRFAASQHFTTPSLCQGLLAVVLAAYTKTSDVSYGVVLSGRLVPVPKVESILLPCITTVVQRADLGLLETVTDAIKRVQDTMTRTLEYQHTPLRHVQRWTDSSQRLFDCLFSYVTADDGNSQVDLWTDMESYMPADYPLSIEFEANPAEDSITVCCSWDSQIGNVNDAEIFLEKIDFLLAGLLEGQSITLASLGVSKTSTDGQTMSKAVWDEENWSEMESKLQQLVSDYCQVPITQVKKNTSFISLGIDSVTSIPFSRFLRGSEVQITPSEIIRNQCIGALAAAFHSKVEGAASSHLVEVRLSIDQNKLEACRASIQSLSSQDIVTNLFQCTPLQSGMLTGTLASGGTLYVHNHTIQLDPDVSLDRLRTSWSRLVERTDILRTSFHTLEEFGFAWFGAVHQNPPIQWEEITSQKTLGESLDEISAIMKYDTENAFQTPPVKVWIINGTAQPSLFVLSMHHSLYDGTSIPFIFDDLARTYLDLELPPRPAFHSILEPILQGQEEATSFWSQTLQNYEPVGLPKLPVVEALDSNTYLSTKVIDMDISRIVQACKKIEVTVQTVALLSFAKILAGLVGRRDVCFGHVVAGRSLPIPGIEDTIGPLFNTVPYRVTLDPKFMSNEDLAQRLQAVNIKAQEHQHASLSSIQNYLRSSGSLKKPFLFDSLFVFQNTSGNTRSVDDSKALWQPLGEQGYVSEVEYSLNVEIEQSDESISIGASCKSQFLTQQMLADLVAEFESAFLDIIEKPSGHACSFPHALQNLPLRSSSNISSDSKEVPLLEDENVSEDIKHTVKKVLADASGLSSDLIKSDTTIFSLGLDSIAAIRVAANCRAQGLDAGVADIVQGGTLLGICRRIEATRSLVTNPTNAIEYLIPQADEQTALRILHLEQDKVERILPCLAGQIYHIASWLNSGRTLFEPAWPLKSRERLDPSRLRTAWANLRRYHPILRSCFVATSPETAYQVILNEASVEEVSSTFELIEMSSSNLKDALISQARTEGSIPSTLFVPPVRLRLVRATDADGLLLILNHSTYDAWSMPLLIQDLTALYQGQEATSNPRFADFVDFNLRQDQVNAKTFWKSHLHDSSPTLLMKSFATSSSKPQRQTFLAFHGAIPDLTRLTSICQSHAQSLPNIIFTAIFRTLSRLTSTPNPTFGLYQVGRSSSFHGIEKLAAPCVNVLPFTSTHVLERSPLEVSTEIQKNLHSRIPYEQTSLPDVLNWAGKKGNPIFDVWINLLWAVDEFQIGSSSSSSSSNNQPTEQVQANSNNLLSFHNLNLVPTALASPTPFPTGQTSVEALRDNNTTNTTFLLPRSGLYVDIGPERETDSIGFGVRCECDENVDVGEGMRMFVRAVCEDVGWIVDGWMD